MKYFFFFITFFMFVSCGHRMQKTFETVSVPNAPDYSNPDHWAALPTRDDNASRTPGSLQKRDKKADVAVFFLHPTSYYGKKAKNWNAAIDDQEVNDRTDSGSMLYQATAFNFAGDVFAPRYRQAILEAYYSDDKASAKKAFDIAYEDVKNAFAYFIANYSEGRPIIIASHSQGTTHAARLLEEFIDNKPLEKRLVAAYLIGIPVDLDKFTSLKACESADDTACLVGWRTFRAGSSPKVLKVEKDHDVLITNPLSWKTSDELVLASENKGTLFYDWDVDPTVGVQNAQIHESILWTNKPKFKGSWLLFSNNYHRGDINLFYVNIRENAANRVAVFLNNK